MEGGNKRRNMKHLIELFEVKSNTDETEDPDDVAETTQEAYNMALGTNIIRD